MILRLKEILKSKGVSSVSLAEKLGVTKVTVSYWINGKVPPATDKLEKIAEILEIPIWELFISKEELLEEPQNTFQRWHPEPGEEYWFVGVPNRWDFENTQVNYKESYDGSRVLNNCFKTEAEAKFMASIIRRVWGYPDVE